MKTTWQAGEPIRVFVADANAMACHLMARVLQQSCQPIKVVGSATESVEILKGLDANPSDVAIISADLRDGPITGFRVVREARATYPHTRFIVLVASPERALVVEGFRAGADGVLSRDEPFDMVCKCIPSLCVVHIWVTSDLTRF